MRERRNYSNALKAKIVLEVIKGEKTMAEIASAHGVHPNQISKWKRQVLEGLPDIFSGNEAERHRQETQEQLIAQLYQQIGQLKLIKEDSELLKIPFLVRGKIMGILEAAFQKEKELFEKKLFDFWENNKEKK